MEIQIDFDRALIYIDEHGNLQDKARLLHILMDVEPPAQVVRPLLDKQNPDGGFPSRPRGENPSSVDNTLTALWQLHELGMLESAEAVHALDFLIHVQQEDGSWDENPALPRHDLPPWIVPGEQATILYLTAYTAFWLGLRGMAPRPPFQKAVQYLASQQEAGGRLPGYLHGNWIGASAFFIAGDAFRQNAERVLSALLERPFGEWEDSQIAWALDCLASAGLTIDHPFIHAGIATLGQRQEPTGCWSSEDGPAYAVSATVSALKVFKRFGFIEM